MWHSAHPDAAKRISLRKVSFFSLAGRFGCSDREGALFWSPCTRTSLSGHCLSLTVDEPFLTTLNKFIRPGWFGCDKWRLQPTIIRIKDWCCCQSLIVDEPFLTTLNKDKFIRPGWFGCDKWRLQPTVIRIKDWCCYQSLVVLFHCISHNRQSVLPLGCALCTHGIHICVEPLLSLHGIILL